MLAVTVTLTAVTANNNWIQIRPTTTEALSLNFLYHPKNKKRHHDPYDPTMTMTTTMTPPPSQ
jgi:hypothetical protein